ncbi:peptidase S28 [Hesseltinella vesiculosa]|uniref:Peptidase S28 n=1 Tax=Hesseltinella vesiculosa TaxID=101127 RepID=A0A1X2GIX0_9FUNG|nr:peptidase S28 [Hesseltinella vesiculosa]
MFKSSVALVTLLAGLVHAIQFPRHRLLNDDRQVLAQSLDAKYGPFYFDQRVDHEAGSTATFRQRLWVNADWYQENGPVILYNAGEMPADERAVYVTNSSMALLARELNGAVIVMEHRSYGQSQPGPDYSTKYLKTLTTANALSDMANIILHFEIPALGRALPPPEAQWIVYGGSYSGNLAAWMRQKYPDLVFAAVASSAPVQMKRNFYEYFEPIQQYGPPECINAIEQVIKHVDHILATPFSHAKAELKDRFGVKDLTYDDDFAELLSMPLGLWQDMTPARNPFGEFCKVFENAYTLNDQIDAYAGYIKNAVVKSCRDEPLDHCLGTHDPNASQYTDLQSEVRPWMYQVCTEYAYWQTGNLPWKSTIVSRHLNVRWYERQCPLFFGKDEVPHVPAWRAHNKKYDGWHIQLNRTFWLDGEMDPWRTLSVNSDHAPSPDTSNPTAVYAVIPGGVHHWDFFVSDTVSDFIKQLHKDMVHTLRSWLKDEGQSAKETPLANHQQQPMNQHPFSV